MTKDEIEEKKQLVYDYVNSKKYKPMTLKEMAMMLQVPAKQKKDLKEILDILMTEGKINIDIKGKIKKISADVLVGKFMATQRGFGFVRVEGDPEDIFIPEKFTKSAFDNDTVQFYIREQTGGKRREGEIIKVLERGNTMVVGSYTKLLNHGVVVSDNTKFNKEIYIAKENSKGAVTGHKVVVNITDFGSDMKNPEGEITEILGHINDPGVDILSVIKAYGLPEEYPEEVMKQIESINDEVLEEQKKGRTDYRDLKTVTIDGEDAKDLDDAITLTKEGDIYHLGVHIADVSEYVTEGSPLDKEALKRGTSVYLVDRVIPMIPHKLSNGICSLNQGCDRLALSCMMDINKKGEIVSHVISESVINVDRRMSYHSVHKIVEEKDAEERETYKDFIEFFDLMYELADILKAQRDKKGSIDFDFPESKITLDLDGKPVSVDIYERTKANRIIEEFMLAANQTVAEDYYWQELPFVYRTHESPDADKMQELATFIENFGYTIKVTEDGVHPKEIQKLMEKIAGKPEEGLISMLSLRSMKQAKYTVGCEGHFGLAMKYYCHFTSPIRRYPDLQIHRIIKENIHGKLTPKRIAHYEKILPEVTFATSTLERRADESEREVDKMKKAQYMEQFVGNDFEGIISGITSWGMYVQLPNTIEGMIRVADIPGDYYYYDEKQHTMIGERTGRVFRLGENISVTLDNVNRTLNVIDFVLNDKKDDEEDLTAQTDKTKSDKSAKTDKKYSAKKIVKEKKAAVKAAAADKKKSVSKSAKELEKKAIARKKSVTEKKSATAKKSDATVAKKTTSRKSATAKKSDTTVAKKTTSGKSATAKKSDTTVAKKKTSGKPATAKKSDTTVAKKTTSGKSATAKKVEKKATGEKITKKRAEAGKKLEQAIKMAKNKEENKK